MSGQGRAHPRPRIAFFDYPDVFVAAGGRTWSLVDGSAAEECECRLGQGFVGDPAQVKGRLEHLAAELQIEELVVVTITHDPRARQHSYELLADAFELHLNHAANSPSAAAR